jgi:16S rRNA (cytidine1402-2'-O)-methyltransferase
MPGTLFLVATPIGNLEDITFRAIRILREASVVAAEDTRRTATLLAHYGIRTPLTSLHEHNERVRVPALINRVRAGETVAVVTDAGMPGISDPGYRVVQAAREAGDIRIEIVPGASALTAAVSGAGLPTDRLTFLGFPPARQGQRTRWFEALEKVGGTLVFFEAPHRLLDCLVDLRKALGDREVVIAHELTKLHESWHRGFVSDLLTTQSLPQKGEFTVVVAPSRNADGPAYPITESLSRIASEFGELTKNGELTRREAIAQLAQRHQLSKRTVYALVEKAKQSVK